MSKKLLLVSFNSFNLSKFILNYPVIMRLLQLFSNADIIDENSFINAFMSSFLVPGGLYMFLTVTFLDRLPPFIWIINPSQCS